MVISVTVGVSIAFLQYNFPEEMVTEVKTPVRSSPSATAPGLADQFPVKEVITVAPLAIRDTYGPVLAVAAPDITSVP